MMRARNREIMVEALKDLQELPAWNVLMALAVDISIPQKKKLLVGLQVTELERMAAISRFQGVFSFFEAIAKETKTELPPKFIEHFTGENKDDA